MKGTIGRFFGSRMKPNPIGRPEVDFRRYSYGQMKSLHVTPTDLSFDGTSQTFLDVFVPANYWADKKKLILEFGWDDHIDEIPDGDFFELDTYYNFQANGDVAQGSGDTLTGGAKTGRNSLQWEFLRVGDFAYDITRFQNAAHQSIGELLTGIEWQDVLPPDTPLDFTADMHILINLFSSGTVNSGTINCIFAKAFIESPLNIRRFT